MAINRAPAVLASLRSVSKHYGQIAAIEDLSLDIEAGQVVALLGPNGAGKTTCVNLLLGLLQPDAGSVALFGDKPDAAGARTRVGAMLQISRVPDTLCVAEHIRLFSSYYPRPMAMPEVIELAGLKGLERRQYGKLSGGQQQRLKFALAICGNPQLLFLDEPTVGLDVEARRDFWSAIRNLIGRGCSVLLTTHYLEEADALADRIVVMDRGWIIADGTPAEIKARTAGRRIRCVTTLGEDVIAGLPGVTHVAQHGAATEILAGNAEPVVFSLLQMDSKLRDLEVSGAGLEQAFLSLTRRTDTHSEAA